MDRYQIKNVLDDSKLSYSRHNDFTQSIEYCFKGNLGYILNQENGSPNDTETLYIFYKLNNKYIADMMETSDMEELKAIDKLTRIFRVKNLDDLKYIINKLEKIKK